MQALNHLWLVLESKASCQRKRLFNKLLRSNDLVSVAIPPALPKAGEVNMNLISEISSDFIKVFYCTWTTIVRVVGTGVFSLIIRKAKQQVCGKDIVSYVKVLYFSKAPRTVSCMLTFYTICHESQ